MLATQPTLEDLTANRLSTAAGIEDIAAAWNELAGDVPFRRYEWLEAWWRHYERAGWELFVLAVRDAEGALVALAPWYRHRTLISGRTIAFLGSGEVCSDYLTVLAAPELAELVAVRLADWLTCEGRDEWDTIELDGIERQDPVVGGLIQALEARGCLAHRRQRIGAWRLELPGDWKSYTSRLSKSRRGGVRTVEKRYFETGRARVRSAECAAEVERGLAILHDLHQRRRKSLGDSGCFASPRFAGFLAEVARRFHALGRLRLQWIELDGRPVAAEFDLSSSAAVYHYQSGIDPDAMPDKPGWLMQISALKKAIEEGFQAFDFLRGDEPYKSWWRAERRPLFEVRLVAPRVSARLRHGVWAAGVRGKAWLRGFSEWVKQRRSLRGGDANSNE
ncbi:MAG TPA: GNAT family N-acetyltransferase [Pirellulales bacterium]|nr:GNAT family N-acetyltransferase [Pirellulales bacterium]